MKTPGLSKYQNPSTLTLLPWRPQTRLQVTESAVAEAEARLAAMQLAKASLESRNALLQVRPCRSVQGFLVYGSGFQGVMPCCRCAPVGALKSWWFVQRRTLHVEPRP